MTRLTLVTLWVIPLALAGCKQDEGERCQTAGDCGDGLVCCPPDEVEGTCQTDCTAGEGEAEAEGEDAGPVDAAPPDVPGDGPVDIMLEPTVD